ncbi:hypothetical protein RB595_007139 [Gaeumannomyces hyphopodioides]
MIENLHSHSKLASLRPAGRFSHLLRHYIPSYKFFFSQRAGWASFSLAILSCNQYFFAHFAHSALDQDPHGKIRTAAIITALEIPLGTWVGPWLVKKLGATVNGIVGCSLHALTIGLAIKLPPVETRLSLGPEDMLMWFRLGFGVSRAGLILFDLAVRDINHRLIKDKDYVVFSTAEIAIATLFEALGHFLAVIDTFPTPGLPPDFLLDATLGACVCSFVVFSTYLIANAVRDVCIRRRKRKGGPRSGRGIRQK